jgi:endonuclease YncB( thermonuclease family)
MKRLLRFLATAFAAGMALGAVVNATAKAQSTKAPDCATTHGTLPEKWEGVAFAIDGGTLAGAGLKPRIRLWGIQAPELRGNDRQETTHGMRARAAVEDLLLAGDRRVTCRSSTFDRTCYMVAQCTVTIESPRGSPPAPQDISLRLLEDGFAYGVHLDGTLPWDKSANERYGYHEGLARQARKGLWPVWLGEK